MRTVQITIVCTKGEREREREGEREREKLGTQVLTYFRADAKSGVQLSPVPAVTGHS